MKPLAELPDILTSRSGVPSAPAEARSRLLKPPGPSRIRSTPHDRLPL